MEVDVLDGVQTEAVHVCDGDVPFPPAGQLLHHLGVGEGHVGPHQVVVVLVLLVHRLIPVAPREFVDAGLFRPFVPVHAVKIPGAPDEFRVLAVAAGEGEAGPGLDVLFVGDGLGAVIGSCFHGGHLFLAVGPHAVVEDDVGVDLDAGVLEGSDGGQVFFLGTVLGPDGALLVKLTQIVGVVHAVAHVVHAGLALVGRGQPDAGDPPGRQMDGVLGHLAPQALVCGQVPFKILHHYAVGHGVSASLLEIIKPLYHKSA